MHGTSWGSRDFDICRFQTVVRCRCVSMEPSAIHDGVGCLRCKYRHARRPLGEDTECVVVSGEDMFGHVECKGRKGTEVYRGSSGGIDRPSMRIWAQKSVRRRGGSLVKLGDRSA